MFLLLTMFVVILSACGSESTGDDGDTSEDTSDNGTGEEGADDGETTTITYSLDQPSSHIWVEATNHFADLVEEKTNGSVKVEVHDSASLGTQREALEGMQVGTMDGTVSLEPISGIVEEIGLFGIPYLFEDSEHLQTFLEEEPGQELNEMMTEEGLRPLTYFMRAPRQVSSNEPVESVEDLEGMNIRVPESPTAPPAFEAMGARVVTMPVSEVYSALEQNVIDAQENPLTQIYSDNFYEVQDHIALTNHQYQAAYLLISEDTFQSLSEEEQNSIQEAAQETQEFESELQEKELEEAYNGLEEEGVEINEPDTSEFADAASEAYGEYDDVMQEWIDKAQEVN